MSTHTSASLLLPFPMCIKEFRVQQFYQKSFSQFVAICPGKSEAWDTLENGNIWITWNYKSWWKAWPALFKKSILSPDKEARFHSAPALLGLRCEWQEHHCENDPVKCPTAFQIKKKCFRSVKEHGCGEDILCPPLCFLLFHLLFSSPSCFLFCPHSLPPSFDLETKQKIYGNF